MMESLLLALPPHLQALECISCTPRRQLWTGRLVPGGQPLLLKVFPCPFGSLASARRLYK
jgi:hypothetical protein